MSDGRVIWDGRAKSRLKKLLKAGATYREIAGIFHCTPSAVGGQVHRMGLTRPMKNGRPTRAENFKAVKPDPVAAIFLNGDPLVFAETGESCARCGVREDVHRIHGCGQFAGELRVREK